MPPLGNDDGLHPVADQVGDAGEGDAGDGKGIRQLFQLPGPPGGGQGGQVQRLPGVLNAVGGLQKLHGLRRGAKQGDSPRRPPGEEDGLAGGTAKGEGLPGGGVFEGLTKLGKQAGKLLFQLSGELVRQGQQLRDVPAPTADFTEEPAQFPGVEGAVEVAVEGVGQEEAGVLPGDSGLQKVPIGREEPVHIAAVQVQVLPLQLRGNVVAQAAEVHVAPGLDGEGGQAELNEKLLHKDGHVPQGDGEDGVLNEGLVAGGQDLPNEGPVLGIPPGVFKDRLGVPGGGGDAGGAGADLLAIRIAADDFGMRFPFHVDTPFCVIDYRLYHKSPGKSTSFLPPRRGRKIRR